MTPVTAPADTQRTAYLKGEPKALGTVQIMIAIITLLFSICLDFFNSWFYCSALYRSFIISGALSVASVNQQNPCVIKATLGMNVFSTVVAGLDIILYSFHGFSVVLLFFALLKFIISICTSVFACKATSCSATKDFPASALGARFAISPEPNKELLSSSDSEELNVGNDERYSMFTCLYIQPSACAA
ncbi:membrane-spanning 4-domains subfamily A member 15-like [Hemibagrus wyckioides]|uniref:membrane-spanning 4-domains subfamily A member 15-like n=1 Tax=Hemibagrus wyckioides TaxID=337641 RepID=UPI00266B8A7E|nr:membrane-spanning 4-domains subfamily A member 15-like [Hemibagrus wyckioides]